MYSDFFNRQGQLSHSEAARRFLQRLNDGQSNAHNREPFDVKLPPEPPTVKLPPQVPERPTFQVTERLISLYDAAQLERWFKK